MCVDRGWYYLEAKQVDEVSLKNYKNIFTIISAVSLCLTVIKASNILDVFIPSFTYLCSNLLAFYAINARSAEKLKSRERVKKAYIYILGTIFVILLISESIKINFLVFILLIICKIVLFISAFIAPYYSIIDDISADPESLKELRKETKEQIEEDKKSKIFSTRNSRIERNKATKEFIEKHEKKKRGEGRRD